MQALTQEKQKSLKRCFILFDKLLDGAGRRSARETENDRQSKGGRHEHLSHWRHSRRSVQHQKAGTETVRRQNADPVDPRRLCDHSGRLRLRVERPSQQG